MEKASGPFRIDAIGVVRSSLEDRRLAPMQGREGAPDAWIDIDRRYADALRGVEIGDELIIITWLHLADRDVLQVHARGDTSRPKTGVFATRSPARPNPLGVHRVTVRDVEEARLCVEPMEAVDGTPVIDIKRALSAY